MSTGDGRRNDDGACDWICSACEYVHDGTRTTGGSLDDFFAFVMQSSIDELCNGHSSHSQQFLTTATAASAAPRARMER